MCFRCVIVLLVGLDGMDGIGISGWCETIEHLTVLIRSVCEIRTSGSRNNNRSSTSMSRSVQNHILVPVSYVWRLSSSSAFDDVKHRHRKNVTS